MKPMRTPSFSWNRRRLIQEGTSRSIEHLIPLVDEVDRVMTLTCRYCGTTTGPLEVTEDGGDYVVPLGTVFHLLSCPLVLDARTH
ncbi:MAG: hypothetical protein HY657_04465 [Acidobacteria bacterium]|nr:hypothetical protein [Acidobacteriota bacterium]